MPAPKKKQKKKGNNKKKNTNQKNKNKNKNKNNKNNKNKSKNKKSLTNSKAQKKNPNNNVIDDQKDNQPKILGIDLIPLDKYRSCGQTFPPTKTVASLWKDRDFDVNQIMAHPLNGNIRMESSEQKAKENTLAFQQRLRDIREASEVHRQVRSAAQHFIKPGLTMVQICEFIERKSSLLVGYSASSPLYRGWGFPTGCSLNNCAAHYTPNSGDQTKLNISDICKIDFGVQINGNIIDCAFTMTFNPIHNKLMEAVRAATNRGIEVMGIDVRLGDIGGEIQEVMESYECIYNNTVFPVKSIRNLNGHSIGKYIIHGGKTVPIVSTSDNTKMCENELFAIETFGSTGKGVVISSGECSHFALINSNINNKNKHIKLLNQINHRGSKDLYKYIIRRFSTIPFCRRWLDDDGNKRHLMSLKKLVDNEIVRAYPPLCDIKGSYTAQYEHTILLKPTSKEIVSRGDDF